MKKEEKIKKLTAEPEKLSYKEFASESLMKNSDDILNNAIADGKLKAVNDSVTRKSEKEKLMKDGLYFSGFRDYLKKSLADEINLDYKKALNTAAVNDYSNRQNYRDYIGKYNTAQEKIKQSVIDKIVNGGILDKEYALRLAKEAGLSDENALYTVASGVNKAKRKTVGDVLKYAHENALYPDVAKSYALNLGLDEMSADLIFGAIDNRIFPENTDFTKLSTEEYYKFLRKLNAKDDLNP